MLVLDTHILVWWLNGDKALSKKAANAIKDELKNGEIVISSITSWEIAMLVARGRIVLSMDVEQWLNTVALIERVRFYPVDNEIAVKTTELPGEFHKDPADRMIVATARKRGATLIKKKKKILAYPHVKTIV